MIKLTQEQEKTVKQWAKDGYGLSDIQKNLSKQFGISATYMDVRFLAIDLGLEIRDKHSVPIPQIAPENISSAEKHDGYAKATGRNQLSESGRGVVVELDHVMKPGSVVSGTVYFSDGVSASWFLDQLGRLALNASQPDYTPSQQDVQTFQQELRKELEKRGY